MLSPNKYKTYIIICHLHGDKKTKGNQIIPERRPRVCLAYCYSSEAQQDFGAKILEERRLENNYPNEDT